MYITVSASRLSRFRDLASKLSPQALQYVACPRSQQHLCLFFQRQGKAPPRNIAILASPQVRPPITRRIFLPTAHVHLQVPPTESHAARGPASQTLPARCAAFAGAHA